MPPPTDFLERIEVLDRRAFGKIVFEWANGDRDTPKTLEEAEAQLTGIVKFPLPDYIGGIMFVHSHKEVWTVKLPPPEMLADRAATIEAGLEYDVPQEYRDHTGGSQSNLDPMELFEFRVGDYTCSLCG